MRRGCFIGRDDCLLGRLAVDEKKAGERTGVVNDPVHPTNAHSVGIFKGLRPGTLERSFAACGTYLTLQIRKSQCLQGFPATAHRPHDPILSRFEGKTERNIGIKRIVESTYAPRKNQILGKLIEVTDTYFR